MGKLEIKIVDCPYRTNERNEMIIHSPVLEKLYEIKKEIMDIPIYSKFLSEFISYLEINLINQQYPNWFEANREDLINSVCRMVEFNPLSTDTIEQKNRKAVLKNKLIEFIQS